MTVENWPGRGFYRGNKHAAIADAMRLGGMVVIPGTPQPMAVVEKSPKPLDPPHVAATEPGDPKSMGYTGDSCDNCGSTRMVVTGHCNTCLDCGTTTGCS